MRVPVAIVLLLGAALLTACAGGSQAAASKPATSAVTVKSADTMRFDPATITVRAGQPVRLTLDNRGSALVHDWTIDNLDGKKVQAKANPNQQATVEFTPTQPGTYEFYCSEPGHKEAGMVGRLVVQ
jgi:uncharacterized cupredoxin-like copper-binding protein